MRLFPASHRLRVMTQINSVIELELAKVNPGADLAQMFRGGQVMRVAYFQGYLLP